MFEFGLRQDFSSAGQNLERHRRVTLLGDEFGWVVVRKLIHQEKVGGGENVTQKLDALTNQRSNSQHFLRRNRKSSGVDNREQARAEFVDGKPADMLSIEPDGFGVKRFIRRCGRLLEINDRVRAIDA